MGAVNKAILIGNLGRDPEVRYTPGGQPVANFTLATTETYADKQGQRQERTEWHRIVAWGKLAELCGEYLAKGRQVYIEGRIQTREWTDRDSNKRYTTEIVANQITFLGSRGEGGGGGGSSSGRGGGGGSGGGGGQSGSRPPKGGGSDAGQGGGTESYDYGPPPNDDDVPF